jgi:endogenous inhibitor of DNA gyrase (YacG/DUF329 family)
MAIEGRLVRVECPECIVQSSHRLLCRATPASTVEAKCPRCKRIVRFEHGTSTFLPSAPPDRDLSALAR